MVKKNACVFISGTGSNLKNLLKRARDYSFPIKIKLVICNNKKALGLKIAKKNSIRLHLVDTKSRNFEKKILKILRENNISIICLAGYMKILSRSFLKEFGKKVINIHPSLLPKFKGLNTFERILKNREVMTGCTLHAVTENLDAGKIISKKSFYIKPKDNEISLKRKTQNLEYKVFPEAIIKIYRNI